MTRNFILINSLLCLRILESWRVLIQLSLIKLPRKIHVYAITNNYKFIITKIGERRPWKDEFIFHESFFFVKPRPYNYSFVDRREPSLELNKYKYTGPFFHIIPGESMAV